MKSKIYTLFILSFFLATLEAAWLEKTLMPRPRTGAVALEYDNLIYVIGGKDQVNFFNSVDVYDPANNIWDTLSVKPMPTARANAAVVVTDGKIYVIGGRNKQGSSKAMEMYDPSENTWTVLRSLKGPRSGLSAAVHNDSVLIFGGVDSDGFYMDKIEWYDRENDQWEKLKPQLDPPRVSMFFFTFDDTLFFSGGFYFSPLNTMAKLPDSGVWQTGPELSLSRGDGTAIVLGDSVFLIGGETSMGSTDAVEIFLPNTQELIPGGRLNSPRSGHAACVYNDTIYVFGGHGIHSADILSSVVIYHPMLTDISLEENLNLIPRSYITMTSYPNPFNSSTRIDINLPERNYVELDIYDIQGRLVQSIFADYLQAGQHHFGWNTAYRGIASGIYMAVLCAPGKIYTHKILLIK